MNDGATVRATTTASGEWLNVARDTHHLCACPQPESFGASCSSCRWLYSPFSDRMDGLAPCIPAATRTCLNHDRALANLSTARFLRCLRAESLHPGCVHCRERRDRLAAAGVAIIMSVWRAREAQHVASSARELLNKSENERSGVLSTTMSFRGLYRDSVVAKVTGRSDWRVRDLIDGDRQNLFTW